MKSTPYVEITLNSSCSEARTGDQASEEDTKIDFRLTSDFGNLPLYHSMGYSVGLHKTAHP
jgi:hypothetical protein